MSDARAEVLGRIRDALGAGAVEIPRPEYLRRLAPALRQTASFLDSSFKVTP